MTQPEAIAVPKDVEALAPFVEALKQMSDNERRAALRWLDAAFGEPKIIFVECWNCGHVVSIPR